MTITLATPTLNLNASPYTVISVDLGESRRDEVWVEPFGSDSPVLAKVVNRKTAVKISLTVKGTSASDLVTRVEAVRNQFNGQSNTLTWSAGGTVKTMRTYDSQIDPVPFGDVEPLFVAAGQFLIPSWTFSVTRDAKYQSDTRPLVI